MWTFLRAKSAVWTLLLALGFAGASCVGKGGGGSALPGSLYTPVREGQAIGPLPDEPLPYYPYQPREITSLEGVPADVRVRATEHLRQRVGEEFYRRLRFVGGQFVDVNELRRVNPESRRFRTEAPAWLLRFAFEMPGVGIRRYVASVALRWDGSVLREVDLPPVAADPARLVLRPLAEVERILAQQGVIDSSAATVTITYDRSRDGFLWHFEQVLPGGGVEVKVRTVEVDARTGQVVRRS